MSYQIRAIGIYQIDTGSTLVSVLGLRPLIKLSQDITSLAVTCWVLTQPCGGLESQEVVRGRSAEVIRPKQT